MENSHRYPVTSNGHHSGNIVSTDGQPQARQRRPAANPPPRPAMNPVRPAPNPPPPSITAPSGYLDPSTIQDEERRRSIVDPDCQFEKFLTHDLGSSDRTNILSSPTKDESKPQQQLKPVILPPPIRPQHVYAPMPVLGALSLGTKRRRKSDEEANATDFSRLMNGEKSYLITPLAFDGHFTVKFNDPPLCFINVDM